MNNKESCGKQSKTIQLFIRRKNQAGFKFFTAVFNDREARSTKPSEKKKERKSDSLILYSCTRIQIHTHQKASFEHARNPEILFL